MDAKATAPTITINGVTSKPGEPVSLVHLDCGGAMFVGGHDAMIGDALLCEDGPHEGTGRMYCIVNDEPLQTWKF